MTALAASYVTPPADPSQTPTDATAIAALIAQLQTVSGGVDNLPMFLSALAAAAGAGAGLSGARSFADVAGVLHANAAWADGNDPDFAAQLRLGAAVLSSVRNALAI